MHPKPYAKGNRREGSYRDITKPWYGTQRWKDRRTEQLSHFPLCKMCLERGIVRAATIADHREPHKGDELKFWTGELDSLCKPCHDSDKKRIEAGGKAKQHIGLDGWPIT